MQLQTSTHVLIAGSRYATWSMLDYARRAVRRAHQQGYTVIVGDNPKGVDMAVVQECRRLKTPVIVAGVDNFPRNGGGRHGSYIKVERDLYRGAKGVMLPRFTVRDRWMVDQASIGLFIWNGRSPGTQQGYEYMVSRGKNAHLINFSREVLPCMSDTILAVSTYGSQRIKHPHTKKTISAYKVGYTSAASAVLLALYGDKASDVSPRQASYYYIQIDGEVTVRHGFILLKVSAEELARAERVTRRFHRAAVFRWQEGKWFELPSSQNPHYSEVTIRSGCPDFDPTGLRPVSPATGEKESAVQGIRIERSPHDKPWFWLHGETYPYRELLKQHGARWSGKRRAWYLIAWELLEAIQALVGEASEAEVEAVPPTPPIPAMSPQLAAMIEEALAADEAAQAAPPLEMEPQADTQPRIRITKPASQDSGMLDVVQTAVREAKAAALPIEERACAVHGGKRTLARIPQQPCGELTGSITGNVWCYGWAMHEGVCVYLNCGGPRMAVEAIRARLSKGEIVNCVPWDAPTVELTAGEGNTGMYTAYLQNIPEAKFTSLILCHDLLIQPNYGGKSVTFIFHVSDEQAMAQIHQHITRLVKVPVFDEWTGYLWHAGQAALLLRPTRTGGRCQTVDG